MLFYRGPEIDGRAEGSKIPRQHNIYIIFTYDTYGTNIIFFYNRMSANTWVEGANLSPRTAAMYAQFGENAEQDAAKWNFLSKARVTAPRPANAKLNQKTLTAIQTVYKAGPAQAAVQAAQAPRARLYTPFVPSRNTPLETQARPATVRTTLSQGDCFYSATWRALYEQSLVARVAASLGIPAAPEAAFISGLRTIASQNAAAEVSNIYEYLVSLIAPSPFKTAEEHAADGHTFTTIFYTTFAQWHRDIFVRHVTDKAAYVAAFTAGIATPKSWASQVEVGIVKNILAACGIVVNILTSRDPIQPRPPAAAIPIPAPPATRFLVAHRAGNHIITLLNEQDVHFEYFSFLLEQLPQPPAAQQPKPAPQQPKPAPQAGKGRKRTTLRRR